MNPQLFSPGFLFAFLLSTAYGAGFHMLFGGPVKKLLLYISAAWLGFALGQWVGPYIGLKLLMVGPVHSFSASIGAWTALIVSHWLGKERGNENEETETF
jgi:hypothetical protein